MGRGAGARRADAPRPPASHSGAWSAPTRSPVEGELPPGSWRVYEPLRLPPVLRHSLEAFAEHGYHGTSVREIARRLGQTVPAIYYHYENKQALLVTLLQGSIQELMQRCELAMSEAGDDPVEQLSALATCVLLYVGHRRELILLDAEIGALEPDNRQEYGERRRELEALVLRTVEAGIAAGRLATSHPQDAARAVLTLCLGTAGWYDPQRGRLSPEELAERYVPFALRVVGAFTEAPGPARRASS